MIIWGTADHDMVGFDARTGSVRWEFKTRRSVKYAPAIDEARRLVAFASFDKSIYVLDVETGEKRGEWETGEICYTTPLFVDGKLFCGSGDRNLYVIDVDSMELIRKIDLHARVYSSPVRIEDRVVVATSGGRVVEIDVETLEIKGELRVPDAVTNAIAVAEDGSRLYVSTYMNHLFAFERVA
jgi:outer membrane protein assembly factor BamB